MTRTHEQAQEVTPLSLHERVLAVICEQLGPEPHEVLPGTTFIDDLGADSLDLVDLALALEEEFGFVVPDADVQAIRTVRDLEEYVERRLSPSERMTG